MDTQKWTSQIDHITSEFQQYFGKHSSQQLNEKPNAQTWSIAQNMEHLITINETYYPVIQSIRNGTYQLPFLGKIGFMVRFLGNTVLKAVLPDRKQKMKTFPIWEPSQSEIGGDILSRFTNHQAQLKQLIISSEDLLDKGIVISSPANKHIVYKLETAFDIIVSHEQRHLEQAKELLKKGE